MGQKVPSASLPMTQNWGVDDMPEDHEFYYPEGPHPTGQIYWQKTLLSLTKCKILPVRKSNPLQCMVAENCRQQVEQESCCPCSKEHQGYAGLGCIILASRSMKTILLLSSSLVRPLLEYCVQFRAQYYKRDVDLLQSPKKGHGETGASPIGGKTHKAGTVYPGEYSGRDPIKVSK